MARRSGAAHWAKATASWRVRGTAPTASWLPIFGPVGSTFGKVFIYDHQRKKKLTLDWGAPWPAFCRAVLFPAQAAAFGIAFEDEPAVAPPVSP